VTDPGTIERLVKAARQEAMSKAIDKDAVRSFLNIEQ
jgi:hypothetical protein